MAERLLGPLPNLVGVTWVEFEGNWAGLYIGNDLAWQGHPGDFEWDYHLGLKARFNVKLLNSHAPMTLKEVEA